MQAQANGTPENEFPTREMLRLLMAVWRTGSLSKAASAESVPQSSASRYLKKCRDFFGDELFVRSVNGLLPTPRMVRAAGRIERYLAMGDQLSDDTGVFVPSSLKREFRVAAPDNGVLAVLMPAVKRLSRESPGTVLRVDAPGKGLFDQLRGGALDMAVWASGPLPKDIRSLEIYSGSYAWVMRKDHPLTRRIRGDGTPDPEALVKYRKIQLSIGNPDEGEHLEMAPEDPGLEVGLRMPYFVPAPFVLGETDLVMQLPADAAVLWKSMGLACFPVSGESGRFFRPCLIWHSRTENDPASQWIRSVIVSEARNWHGKVISLMAEKFRGTDEAQEQTKT